MTTTAGLGTAGLGTASLGRHHDRAPDGSTYGSTLPGLHDLELTVAADGALAPLERPDHSLTAAEIAERVRRSGGTGCDVRLLVTPGEQNLPTLIAAARALGRDVLIPPPGARLVRMPAALLPGERTGRSALPVDPPGDVLPVDETTGYPVDWLTIQPSGEVGGALGWFELVGGLVLPRAGLVALPLPGGGRMLATRETFVAARTAAAALRPGHPELVTVSVGVRPGGAFAFGDYDGSTTLGDGRMLAAALATLPLYRANLRLWFAWPVDSDDGARRSRDDDQRRLRRHLSDLADVTGATVWVPGETGLVEILDGCRDLASVGPDGQPWFWEPFGPNGRFESDVDGRLVPVGGVRATTYPGVPLVSTLPGRERQLADRYARLRPTRGIVRCDLAVLADGRFAVRYADGSLLAVGGRQLARLLEEVGWTGTPVALVSTVSPERVAGARRHLAALGRELGCEITFADPLAPPEGDDGAWPADLPGARPAEAAPEPRRPASPDAVWPAPGYSRSAVASALAELDASDPAQARCLIRLAAALADHLVLDRELVGAGSRRRSSLWATLADLDGYIDELAAARSSTVDDAGPAEEHGDVRDGGAQSGNDEDESGNDEDETAGGLVPVPQLRSRFIDGPRLELAPKGGPSHGLDWLPAQPQTNAETFDAFVECPIEPDRVVADGVPSPALFLVAHLDGERLAEKTRAGYVLRLRVDRTGAVDLSASEAGLPAVYGTLTIGADGYLLPAGWLSRAHLVEAIHVTRGALGRRQALPELPVLLLPWGAAHGVEGLPLESVRWPTGHRRRSGSRHLLVPDGRTAEPATLGPWLAVHQRRPEPIDGQRLLEVRVPRGHAIDITRTASALARLRSVRSPATQLVENGVDVLLPAGSYPYVEVRRTWVCQRGEWIEAPAPADGRLVPAID